MWGLFVCRKCIVCTEVQCENSVQCCEWAGRYFMNGGGIMWPQHLPKQIFLTDCQQAHTRDRLIEKQQHTHIHAKCDLKMGATSTNRHLTHGLKNRHPRIVRDLGVKETPFFRKNAFLWMEIVICKSAIDKKWHLQTIFDADRVAIASYVFIREKRKLSSSQKWVMSDFKSWFYSEIMEYTLK